MPCVRCEGKNSASMRLHKRRIPHGGEVGWFPNFLGNSWQSQTVSLLCIRWRLEISSCLHESIRGGFLLCFICVHDRMPAVDPKLRVTPTSVSQWMRLGPPMSML